MNERELQKVIVKQFREWCVVKRKNFMIFENNNNIIARDTKDAILQMNRRKTLGFVKGRFDLDVIIDKGRALHIELKVGKNKLTPAQNRIYQNYLDNEQLAFVVKSVDEFWQIIDKFVD